MFFCCFYIRWEITHCPSISSSASSCGLSSSSFSCSNKSHFDVVMAENINKFSIYMYNFYSSVSLLHFLSQMIYFGFQWLLLTNRWAVRLYGYSLWLELLLNLRISNLGFGVINQRKYTLVTLSVFIVLGSVSEVIINIYRVNPHC